MVRDLLVRSLEATGRLEASYNTPLTRAAGVWLQAVAQHGDAHDLDVLAEAGAFLFWRDVENRHGQTLEIVRANPAARFRAFSIGRAAWKMTAGARPPAGWRDLKVVSVWGLNDDPQATEAHALARRILADAARSDPGQNDPAHAEADPALDVLSDHAVADALAALRPLIGLLAAERGARHAAGDPLVPDAATVALLARAAGATPVTAERAGALVETLRPLWRDVVALGLYHRRLGQPAPDVPRDADAATVAASLDGILAALRGESPGGTTGGATVSESGVRLVPDDTLMAAFETQLSSTGGLSVEFREVLRTQNAAFFAESGAVLWPLPPIATTAPPTVVSLFAETLEVGVRVRWAGPDGAAHLCRADLADLRAADPALALTLWQARARALTADDVFALHGALSIVPAEATFPFWGDLTLGYGLVFAAIGAGVTRDVAYLLRALARVAGQSDKTDSRVRQTLDAIAVDLLAQSDTTLNEARRVLGDEVEVLADAAPWLALALAVPFVPVLAITAESLIAYGEKESITEVTTIVSIDRFAAAFGAMAAILRGMRASPSTQTRIVESAAVVIEGMIPKSAEVAIRSGEAGTRLRKLLREAAGQHKDAVIDPALEFSVEEGLKLVVPDSYDDANTRPR
ncbi:MAG: hypothetical protein P1U88_15530 [Thalassobaculaceae bacterium]|nr:hypothetical protein [Thalassobaculaceae bacterium]